MHRGGFLHDGMAQLRGAVVGMLFARIAEKVQEMTSGRGDEHVSRAPKRSSARTTGAETSARETVSFT